MKNSYLWFKLKFIKEILFCRHRVCLSNIIENYQKIGGEINENKSNKS